MIIGALKLRLEISGARSLKDKRRVVKSIKDKISSQNISIAEVDDLDLWQASTLGIVLVSNEAQHVNAILDKIVENIGFNSDVGILNSAMEIIHL